MLLEIKSVFRFSLQLLSETFLILRRTEGHMIKNIYRVIQNDCRGKIVQRQFLIKFGKQPPSDNSIGRLYAQLQETG